MIEAAPTTVPISNTNEPRRLHLDFLDGIRALAALFVMFDHAWQGPFGRVARSGITGWLTNWALYGHLAVDVFIVLSGFCLILPVAKSGFISGGTLGFFKRRAHRILPPFYCALALSLPINFAVHKIGHHPLVSIKALLANVFLLQDWLPGFNVLDGPLWSVAAEWKIYFLFPFFVWVWRRFSAVWMLTAAAAIGYGLTLVFHLMNPQTGMGNTCPWYFFLFAFGLCAGGVAVPNDQKIGIWLLNLKGVIVGLSIVLGFLLLKYPITVQGEDILYGPHLPLIDPVVGALTAAVLVFLNQKRTNNQSFWLLKMLSWKPLVFIGTFSYSIYLIHIPLLGLAGGGLHRIKALNSPVLLPTVLFLVMFPAIIALAYVFHLLFERPFLNKRSQASSYSSLSDKAAP